MTATAELPDIAKLANLAVEQAHSAIRPQHGSWKNHLWCFVLQATAHPEAK